MCVCVFSFCRLSSKSLFQLRLCLRLLSVCFSFNCFHRMHVSIRCIVVKFMCKPRINQSQLFTADVFTSTQFSHRVSKVHFCWYCHLLFCFFALLSRVFALFALCHQALFTLLDTFVHARSASYSNYLFTFY